MKTPPELSLRDYFAAQALQALIIRDGKKADSVAIITATAYQYADDMLIERDAPVVVPRYRHQP